MAEYIRFRLTSAKLGVTMALAALIGGVADRAQAQSAAPGKPAPLFVKLTGITGPVRTVLAKIEQKCITLGNEIGSLEKKVRTDYYTKDQIGKVYLKDATANAEFLKIRDATTEFVKKADALAEFVIKGETVANSNELGGHTAQEFIQGTGGVVTGAVTVQPTSGPQMLLQGSGSDAAIIVVAKPNTSPGGGVDVMIHNSGASALPAVQDVNGQAPTPITIPADNGMKLTTITGTEQFHLQTFPAPGFNQVLTLTLSGEITGNGISIVGQMLGGAG